MIKLGFVGWRGMVGRVLLEQMRQEDDFQDIEVSFFSTSQAGQLGPSVQGRAEKLQDAFDMTALHRCDVIISCQGSHYTEKVQPKLRAANWSGFWLDAASHLRMNDDSVIVLEPLNGEVVSEAMKNGVRDFIGGNCTVSLMLLSLAGLLQDNLIEWVSVMTYQAVSGAGAKAMRELISQMQHISGEASELLQSDDILALDATVTESLHAAIHPTETLQAPLAGSLIPWIDSPMPTGQTREEWKGSAEASKILQRPFLVDGLCVRMAAMRCHSQGLTFKLKEKLTLSDVVSKLDQAHPWVHAIENTPEATRAQLTPAAVSGHLDIPIGRIRPSQLGDNIWHAFTVGDQLLWGAAEPLRYAFKRAKQHLQS